MTAITSARAGRPRRGPKTGNRAPLLSQSVIRGLAAIGAGIVDPTDKDTAAALKWCREKAALCQRANMNA